MAFAVRVVGLLGLTRSMKRLGGGDHVASCSHKGLTVSQQEHHFGDVGLPEILLLLTKAFLYK